MTYRSGRRQRDAVASHHRGCGSQCTGLLRVALLGSPWSWCQAPTFRREMLPEKPQKDAAAPVMALLRSHPYSACTGRQGLLLRTPSRGRWLSLAVGAGEQPQPGRVSNVFTGSYYRNYLNSSFCAALLLLINSLIIL